MPNTQNYLKQFVVFSTEQLQQNLPLESFRENLINEARAILNNAAAQPVSIELQRLDRYLQSEIKYQLHQYKKKHTTVAG